MIFLTTKAGVRTTMFGAGMVLCFLSVITLASTRAGRILTYGQPPANMNYFGPCILHESGWDRYLMYYSINSSILNSKPSNATQGDPGTYNSTCNTYWADRIWLSWHFGDGKSPTGWDADDGYGTTTPKLMLTIGGAGESALIGDPAVVSWQNKWHMYYEGTDDCGGNGNRIFHADANNWFGPWQKRGEVKGLIGGLGGSALSWPSTLVENGHLYLYFNDGCIRIRAAEAIDPNGHVFEMKNYNSVAPNVRDNGCGYDNPKAISPELIPEAQVVNWGSGYAMIYSCDRFNGGDIRMAFSTDKFNFPVGKKLLVKRNSSPQWENFSVNLLGYLCDEEAGEHRIYYTGTIPTFQQGSIGVHYWPINYNCNDADAFIDHIINFKDFAVLGSNWLIEGWPNPNSDITGNGIVDMSDIEVQALWWLRNCP